MAFYIIAPSPETGQQMRLDNASITKVHPNGTFDAVGEQWAQAYCNPDIFKVYNSAGEQVDPASAIPTPAAIEGIQKQLIETQAALAAVYETLAAMVGGGLDA